MMGPTWLDGFPAVIPIAQKNGVRLVTPSAAIEAFTDKDRGWPVTFYHNSTTEIKVLVKALQTRGFSRIALIFEQEPFAEMMRRLLKSELSSLVADIGIQGGEGDFHSSLLKLRQRRIDALVIFVWNQRSLLSLLQQLRMNLPNVQLASVHDGAGWLLDSAFRAQINRLLYTKFLVVDSSFEDRFRTRFGYSPILTASNAYDALNAVLSAIAAGAKSAQSIRDHLTKKEIDSVTFGKFRFNNDGSVPSKVDIVDYAQEKANGGA